MHIPDGFIDAPTSAAAAVVAAGGLALCLRSATRELDERTAPLAGLVAVFVFAGQMLNFPVAAGTSGHLVGAALAAILVGPATGALAVSVVVMIQALMFADGGLSALGLNILNLALIPVLVAWPTFRLIVRTLPRRRPTWLAASFCAGLVSVPAAAASFCLEYALGGSHAVALSTVLAAMLSTHVLIGIGEGLITALVVGSVLATRPDLVAGVRDLLPRPVVAPVPVAA
jgi:cobalt/nickel transport system permease protein